MIMLPDGYIRMNENVCSTPHECPCIYDLNKFTLLLHIRIHYFTFLLVPGFILKNTVQLLCKDVTDACTSLRAKLNQY